MASWAAVAPRLQALQMAGMQIDGDHMHKLEAARLARIFGDDDAILLFSKDVPEDDDTVVMIRLATLENLIANAAHTLHNLTP